MNTQAIVDGSQQTANIRKHYQVVIVGSGAGGAVLAKELAEGGIKVALIEEGHYWKPSDHTDLPYESLSRLYRDKGFITTLGKPVIPIPLGKALGGTTVINSGTCFRTPTKVFKRWQHELDLTDLNEINFLPLFEKVEKEIHVEEADYKVMSKANLIFHELLGKRGILGKALKRNIKACEGCGFCCYGCPSGAKQSMDVSYLPKAFKAGAVAYTNCKVVKLLKQGKKVFGVQGKFYSQNGKPTSYELELTADYVVLAAGTILTPILLQQNGIRNKHIGRHLTIHPATKIFAQFDEEINGWEGTPQAYYLDNLSNEGIFFEGIFVPPDIFAMGAPFVGPQMNEFMRNYKHMAAFGFLISDSSTGRVLNLPIIGKTILYNLNQTDIDKIKKGAAYLARIFLEGGAKKVYTLLHGFTELNSLDDVARLENTHIKPADYDGMAFHPLGTCRMSPTIEKGVVGLDYKIHGWEGIYICDGSIIPSALGVNPQVTIMAFATRFAQQILSQQAF